MVAAVLIATAVTLNVVDIRLKEEDMARNLLFAAAVVCVCVIPSAVFSGGAGDYVGVDTCTGCHGDIADAYAKTPHVKSLEILKAAGSDSNAECLPCHTTGFEGGEYTDGAVTCEACHGAGAAHAAASMDQKKSTIHRDVTAEDCTKCHNADWSPDFDFASYKEKGTHKLD